MTREFRDQPLITILLAILIVAMSAIGVLMNNHFNQLWTKLDRVTAVMLDKEAQLRAENRDILKLHICTDQEVQRLKESMAAHLKEYERANNKR